CGVEISHESSASRQTTDRPSHRTRSGGDPMQCRRSRCPQTACGSLRKQSCLAWWGFETCPGTSAVFGRTFPLRCGGGEVYLHFEERSTETGRLVGVAGAEGATSSGEFGKRVCPGRRCRTRGGMC